MQDEKIHNLPEPVSSVSKAIKLTIFPPGVARRNAMSFTGIPAASRISRTLTPAQRAFPMAPFRQWGATYNGRNSET